MTWAGMALLSLGALLLIISAWGVIALPDALSRQHAATKAGAVALSLVLLGAFFLVPTPAWAWRLGVILVFLLATLPIASHLLARAAVVEAGLTDEIRDAPLLGESPKET